jgi:hypothetical protein
MALKVKPDATDKDFQMLLHRLMNEAEEEIVDHPVKPDRFFFLRPSGFPYCGLRKLLTAPKQLTEGETSELAGGYFTAVGTAAHTTFQSHIGRNQFIVGNWKCNECGKFTKFHTFRLCKCGSKPVYEELEVKYKNTVVGHLDGLVKIKMGDRWIYIVIDYKTATTSKIAKGRTDDTVFPYAYNVQQIKRYVVLLELCYNIKVHGWALIYLNRDVPLGEKNRNIVYVTVPESEKKALKREMDEWVKTHRMVLRAHSLKHFKEIEARKLCSSAHDYRTNWMNDYSKCPIEPFCFDSKRLERKIDEKLGHKVYPLINMAPKHIRKGLDMKKVEV